IGVAVHVPAKRRRLAGLTEHERVGPASALDGDIAALRTNPPAPFHSRCLRTVVWLQERDVQWGGGVLVQADQARARVSARAGDIPQARGGLDAELGCKLA